MIQCGMGFTVKKHQLKRFAVILTYGPNLFYRLLSLIPSRPTFRYWHKIYPESWTTADRSSIIYISALSCCVTIYTISFIDSANVWFSDRLPVGLAGAEDRQTLPSVAKVKQNTTHGSSGYSSTNV